MIKEKRNRLKGILGTILFHAGLLLLLLFLALRTPLPLPGEEGVFVNLGYDLTGMGLEQQPEQAAPVIKPQPAPQQEDQIEEDYLVQDIEEAPAIEKKKEEVVKKEPVKPIPDPEPVKVTEEPIIQPEPEPQPNPRAMYKGKGSNTAQGGQEGITGQPGDQGDPSGVPGATVYKGKSGAGNGEGTGAGTGTGEGDGSGEGISASLGNRGHLILHKPTYDSKEQGKVVVTIKVDRNGKVISAVAGAKGTNVSDQALWQLARDAALKSTFEADPNAPDVQAGTITYNFIRQN
jgi:periplasmic protein TonB